jgi:hypothetical protein
VNTLTIGKPTAWLIAIFNFGVALLQLLSYMFDMQINIDSIYHFYWGTLAIGIVIFANDIFYNNVYQKWFWITSVVILAPVTPLFYIVQRNKLIRLGNKAKQGN